MKDNPAPSCAESEYPTTEITFFGSSRGIKQNSIATRNVLSCCTLHCMLSHGLLLSRHVLPPVVSDDPGGRTCHEQSCHGKHLRYPTSPSNKHDCNTTSTNDQGDLDAFFVLPNLALAFGAEDAARPIWSFQDLLQLLASDHGSAQLVRRAHKVPQSGGPPLRCADRIEVFIPAPRGSIFKSRTADLTSMDIRSRGLSLWRLSEDSSVRYALHARSLPLCQDNDEYVMKMRRVGTFDP